VAFPRLRPERLAGQDRQLSAGSNAEWARTGRMSVKSPTAEMARMMHQGEAPRVRLWAFRFLAEVPKVSC